MVSSVEWYESVCFDEPFLPWLSLTFIGSFLNRYLRFLLYFYLFWFFLLTPSRAALEGTEEEKKRLQPVSA